jgi:hypothetical protein
MSPRIAISQRTASEQPASPTAKQGAVADCSEALITCCALALEIRSLSVVLSRAHAETLVTQAKGQRSDEQILRWRQFTFESSWQVQWAAARRVVFQFYPELPGVNDIARDHWNAGLPEISTAGVT